MKKKWIVILNSVLIIGLLLFIILSRRIREGSEAYFETAVVFVVFTILVCFDLFVMLTINRNLEQAALAAEYANRSKSEFLSNMSHEIRTPITAVLGMNEMIRRQSSDADVLEYADNIHNAGVSLLGIISDILDFSRIEAGKMELYEVEYSLPEMVSDLVNLTQFRAELKGLVMKTKLDPMLPKGLFGDEQKIKQVVMNLLSNAVKYTHEGTIELEFSLLDFSSDEIVMEISVSDTGIGIREDEMSRLFQAFDRLDEKRNRSIVGSGLGLAITSRMLQMMHSSLEVKSRYGSGSRFYFTLKQRVWDWDRTGSLDAAQMHSMVLKNDKLAAADFEAPGVRTLIVDDTPMNLQVIVGLLNKTGMMIDVAADGNECIRKFEKNEYDVVFLDYRMPSPDGIETLSVLKEKYPEKRNRTCIISLTASAIVTDREKMLSAGFDDYMTKPVSGAEMKKVLKRHLGDRIQDLTQDSDPEKEEISLPEGLKSIQDIDTEKGMGFCGDAEDYLDALEVFANSLPEKAKRLEQLLENRDIEGYTLVVHSLKSTAGAVGATGISEGARELEMAGREGNVAMLLLKTGEYTESLLIMGKTLKQLL